MIDKLKQYQPIISLVLGTAGLITSIALGATGEGMITIGSSNLPMVLGLASTSLLIFSRLILNILMAEGKAHKLIELLGGLLFAGTVIGCGYLGTHLGIAPHLTSLGSTGALGAEMGISFGLGIVGFFLLMILYTPVYIRLSGQDLPIAKTEYPNLQPVIAITALGLCVMASTVLPSALMSAMGAAAADATQAAALEAMIAVSIITVSDLLVNSLALLPDYISQKCGKAKQV
ncbi:MAG: hypothetical protein JSS50_04990 [Proteobacteria bacterium]|nr:hypothetical protein [Pseudomonadota bacterium]